MSTNCPDCGELMTRIDFGRRWACTCCTTRPDQVLHLTGMYRTQLGRPASAPLNCRNCGAPPESGACSYCATP